MHRRTTLTLLLTLAAALPGAAVAKGDWKAIGPGTIVLFRHANAPGVGDPPNFKLGDCSTQRNLDEAGREQARRIGAAFRARKVDVRAVWSSQWCRARDTADLAFPGRRKDLPAFNSFFNDEPRLREEQTKGARDSLRAWRGPGVLVVFSHQVNITALTGAGMASGEGVIVRAAGEKIEVLGRITP
jgi:phosphohistidine phosphatase SixA